MNTESVAGLYKGGLLPISKVGLMWSKDEETWWIEIWHNTDENKEIILSALFNDPHIFGYLRNTWSLRSLAKCLTNELGIPISFKHLQRITKDMGIRCKRPKLELLHGEDYEEGKERVENYKQIASSALKKREL
jgi:transposase